MVRLKLWDIGCYKKAGCKIKYFAPLFILVFAFAAFLQSNEDRYLFWKPGLKLKWSDFHGHVKSEDDASASASYIGFFHKIKKSAHADSILLDTRAFFNKAKSWVKVPSVNPDLLAHEQLHFDLAELFSRKFRRAVEQINIREISLNRIVDSTYKYYANKGDSMHFLYDIETNHGLNRESQYKWNEKVKEELLQLANNQSPFLKICIKPRK